MSQSSSEPVWSADDHEHGALPPNDCPMCGEGWPESQTARWLEYDRVHAERQLIEQRVTDAYRLGWLAAGGDPLLLGTAPSLVEERQRASADLGIPNRLLRERDSRS